MSSLSIKKKFNFEKFGPVVKINLKSATDFRTLTFLVGINLVLRPNIWPVGNSAVNREKIWVYFFVDFKSTHTTSNLVVLSFVVRGI
jgi:hypothetical protein